MKARRLVLCLLLSVAMVMTFIPLTSYAAYGDEHTISFAGDPAVEFDEDEAMYLIDLGYGTAYVSPEDYDFNGDGSFTVHEGGYFDFTIDCESGWFASGVECVADGKEVIPHTALFNGWCDVYIPITGVEIDAYNTITINVAFEEEYDPDDDSIFTDFDEIKDDAVSINAGDRMTVDTEGMFRFAPNETGTYVFYSYYDNDIDPIGRILDSEGYEIQDVEYADDAFHSNRNFRISFEAVAGETYYLQASKYSKSQSATFGIVLMEDAAVTSIGFEPNGEHLAGKSCQWTDGYWNSPDFAAGDKLIVKYADDTAKTFVCKEFKNDDDYTFKAFINQADASEELFEAGNLSISTDPDYAPAESVQAGSVKTVDVRVYFGDIVTSATIKVKFVYWHFEEKHDAAPATCTTAGNTAYWYCSNCGKYFSDPDYQNEIAAGSWAIPAGHKWTHVVNSAGLLVTGSQYDQCTVCGAIANSAVIPGWAKYYVKGLKVKKGKGSLTVKWKKQGKKNLKKFNGYQIRYATKSDMSNAKYKKAGKKSRSKKIGKLKKKTRYYVQVRTYTKKGGVTYYSKWSKKKKVKTK